MDISDVKKGDFVIPRAWETDLPGVRTIQGWRRPMCDKPTRVVQVDHTDNTLALHCEDDEGDNVAWWPVDFCEAVASAPQPNASQLLQHLHEREKAELRRDRDRAVKEAEAAERALTAARSEAAAEVKVLRSQIAALEKQVADLKAERDRVGKTSQTGTMLSEEHKFGAGFRRCAGEHIAREMARLMLERFEIKTVSADLRKVGLITQRLRRITCVITRR